MRIQLRDPRTRRTLAEWEVADLAEAPQPGRWLDLDGQSFLVLQRSHRYTLRDGQYQLAAVALDVKRQRQPDDAAPWRGGWVIGNPHCRFNALSPLLRCAVLPEGPCSSCSAFEPR
jgi:hypothetical protein